jgi:fructose-specific phosphotransferase system IIC component
VGVDVNIKTVLGWLAIAFVVWWIIEQPAAAAHFVHNVTTFLTSMAHGLSNFFASI